MLGMLALVSVLMLVGCGSAVTPAVAGTPTVRTGEANVPLPDEPSAPIESVRATMQVDLSDASSYYWIINGVRINAGDPLYRFLEINPEWRVSVLGEDISDLNMLMGPNQSPFRTVIVYLDGMTGSGLTVHIFNTGDTLVPIRESSIHTLAMATRFRSANGFNLSIEGPGGLRLGMTRDEVISIFGDNYIIDAFDSKVYEGLGEFRFTFVRDDSRSDFDTVEIMTWTLR